MFVEWQPIDTAPRDGTKLLLLCAEPMDEPTYVVGLWIVDSWHSDWDRTMIGPELEVTHWMPLPDSQVRRKMPLPG
jgi:hypothetical protein